MPAYNTNISICFCIYSLCHPNSAYTYLDLNKKLSIIAETCYLSFT